MTGEDDVERTLRAAFDARARGAAGDSSNPPPPRFATTERAGPRRRSGRLLAPLAAAAAVVAVVGGILAVTESGGSGRHHVVGQRSVGQHRSVSRGSSAPRSVATTAPPAAPAVQLVHVTGYPADGAVVGVGMPIIATFNRKITDARQFAQHSAVTVDGRPAHGAWYFEYSDPSSGHIMEAHYRPASYWPAHAHVHVQFAIGKRSAGKNLAFDDKLTSLDFTTGARNIAVVSDVTHRLTLTSDGKKLFSFPVSLGARNTPTDHGVKVVMEKGTKLCMSGPGYHECGVKYTQRLTYAGEYLHAAPWNTSNIEHGVDSSNGCTNLTTADAAVLYKVLRVGDVVDYPDAGGPPMTMGAGYGDWNVSWEQWRRGGALPTR